MQEVTMATVQLNHIVSDAINALRSGGEFVNAAGDIFFGHGVWHRPARVVGNGGRRLRSPTAFRLAQDGLAACCRRRGGPFASGMGKLDAQLGDAVSPAKVMDALERRLVLVGPHARAFRRNAAARIDIGHLAHHESRASQRKAAEVHQMPIVGRAVIGIVLAHRRHHDAVRQGEPAQRDGREEDASHF
jgi:hypothetical protein